MLEIARILFVGALGIAAVGVAGCKEHKLRHHHRRSHRISIIDCDSDRSHRVAVRVGRPPRSRGHAGGDRRHGR